MAHQGRTTTSSWTYPRVDRDPGMERPLPRHSASLCMSLTAEDIIVDESHDGLTPLDPGHEFRLPTTNRIFNQLDRASTDESCGAHAVGAAIESYLVEHHVIGQADQLIDPFQIYQTAGSRRSLRRACEAAATGVSTAIGRFRPVFFNFDSADPQAMVFDLATRRVPLMIEASVDSAFVMYEGTDIYHGIGSDLHAICLIGYGTEAQTGRGYWVAKNSYGEGWGDHGYVRFLWRDPLVQPEENVYSLRSMAE